MAPPKILAGLMGIIALNPLGAFASPVNQFQDLLNRSPFGGVEKAEGTAIPAQQPLEFRAVLEENGARVFSLYDNATRRSFWVGLGDKDNGFSVLTFDEANLSVTLEYHGALFRLPLQRSRKTGYPTVPPPGAALPPAASNSVAKPKYDSARVRELLEQSRLRRAAESSLRLEPRP